MGGGGHASGGFEAVLASAEQTGWRGLFRNPKVFALAAFASLGGVLYGYNQGVFSSVQVMPEFHNRFASTLDDSATKGMLTGILELACFFSASLSGFLADKFSRKYSISAWCIIFCIGSALQAGANDNVAYIYAGRFVTGLGVGAISVVVPLFNAELAPPGIRGTLVALQQLSICFGIMISYWIGFGTNFIGGTTYPGQSSAAWRIPLAIQIVPGMILCIGALFLPFSPRWLMLRDREEECLQTLCKLRNRSADTPDIQYEFKALKAERMVDKETARIRYGEDMPRYKVELLEYKRIFTTKVLTQRLLLGVAINMLGQFSGINAVLYYAPTIFQQVGLSGGTTSLLATGVVGIVFFLVTAPAVFLIDNIGRKPLIIWGGISMTIAHAGIAAIIAVYGSAFDVYKTAGNAAIFLVFWYTCTYGCTWGAANWVIVAETLPLDIRGKGMGLSTSMNWISNFTVAQITPIMITNIGYKTFLVFMVFCVIGTLWGYFILPELKGLSLEEVDEIFKDQTGAQYNEIRDRVGRELGLDRLVDAVHVEHAEADHKTHDLQEVEDASEKV